MSLDTTLIQQKLAEMAFDMLTGVKQKETQVDITISLPDKMLEIVSIISGQTGTDPNEVLAKMARQGIDLKLKDLMSQSTGQTAPQLENNPLAALTPNFAGLEEKLGGLTKIMEQFQQMEKALGSIDGNEPGSSDKT